MLRSKTLVSKQEKSVPGFMKRKKCVTVMACSNALRNHKLELVVIGKIKKSQSIQEYQKTEILFVSVLYKSRISNDGVMKSLFQQWVNFQNRKDCLEKPIYSWTWRLHILTLQNSEMAIFGPLFSSKCNFNCAAHGPRHFGVGKKKMPS